MRKCSKAEEICSKLSGLNLKPASWVKMPRGRVKSAVVWMLPENNSSQDHLCAEGKKDGKATLKSQNLPYTTSIMEHVRKKRLCHIIKNTRHLWTYSLKMRVGGCSESTASSMQERGRMQGLCRW